MRIYTYQRPFFLLVKIYKSTPTPPPHPHFQFASDATATWMMQHTVSYGNMDQMDLRVGVFKKNKH